MNTNTATKNAAAKHLELIGVDDRRAAELLMVDVQRAGLREQMAAVQARYISLLPYATESQMAAVVEGIASEQALPEGMRVNVDFRLSEAQGKVVEAARAKRRDFCATNKDGMVAKLAQDPAEKLTSFKVRIGTKVTTTSLRFERTHAPTRTVTGLLATIVRAGVDKNGMSAASAEAAATA